MSNIDKPNNKMILGYALGGIAGLIVLVVAVTELFNAEVRGEIERKVLSRRDSRIEELRIREAGLLSQYAWVNQAKGTVRIPVERAVELTLRDWSSRSDQPVPLAGVAPAVPAPVDGAAPAVPVDGAAPAVPVDGAAPAPVPAPVPGSAPAPAPAPVPAPVAPGAPQ